MADKTESAADDYTLLARDTDAFAHESHFKGYEGLFVLQTKNNKIFKLKDTCVWAKERGGFTGNVEDMIEHVTIFFRAVVALLREGYGINLAGIIELFLNIGGYIKTPNAAPAPVENPLTLRTRLLHGAAKLVQGVTVKNWGLAPAVARIDSITDSKTNAMNDVLTPGSPFTIEGVMLKVTGTSAPADSIGVSFFAPGTPNASIAVTEPLVLNDPTRIIGVTPDLPPGKLWYVRVRTKYSGSGKELKETREILSNFTVQRA